MHLRGGTKCNWLMWGNDWLSAGVPCICGWNGIRLVRFGAWAVWWSIIVGYELCWFGGYLLLMTVAMVYWSQTREGTIMMIYYYTSNICRMKFSFFFPGKSLVYTCWLIVNTYSSMQYYWSPLFVTYGVGGIFPWVVSFIPEKCGRLDVRKSGVCGAGLNRNMEWGVGRFTYVKEIAERKYTQ